MAKLPYHTQDSLSWLVSKTLIGNWEHSAEQELRNFVEATKLKKDDIDACLFILMGCVA